MIRIENLHIAYKEQVLVNNVSFSLNEGEKVALLGQSGSGKTLTSLAIMHLLPKNLTAKGKIYIDNNTFSPAMRGNTLGMILQSPASCFDQAFTIRHFFYDALKAQDKNTSDEFFCSIIEEVGLKNPYDILNSYPFQLSGGMLQRIMIGLCLALETRFVIADEPTSDIDCIAENEILSLLNRLTAKGQGLLLITHTIKTACKIADKILVMHKGELVDSFASKELYSNTRHPFTKELIQAHKQLNTNNWGVNFNE